jgi:hypothetical protein
LAVSACSEAEISERPGAATASTAAVPAACNEELRATEVGIAPDTITVTVVADTDNPVRPGLFLGSWKGVQAWAKDVNARGGLACRRVEVKTANSALSPDEARNAVSTACKSSVALVGTTALFLQDVSVLDGCKDKAGRSNGLPDIALLQTEPTHQCSPVSYAVLPLGASCPYSGSGPRDFRIATTPYDYYFNTFGRETLHGVFVIPKDLTSTIAAAMPSVRAVQQLGVANDGEFGMSGLATQPDYSRIATTMRNAESTYARNLVDYAAMVLLRKEAKAQGVTTVKVWDCNFQCYDERLITESQGATEGQYVWLTQLPFEDAGHNPALDTFLRYDEEPDGFGLQAFVAGLMFERAVKEVVARDGPNGITREALLDAIRNTHDFDAGGLIPKTDVGDRQGSVCFVGMQVQGGKFVRIDPPEPGTFDCRGTMHTLTLDPLEAYNS